MKYQINTPADLKNIVTDCKALNWCIARTDCTDHSDDNGVYFIGEFVGKLNRNMADDIRTYFGKFEKQSKVLDTDNATYSLQVSVNWGNYNSSKDRVYISFCRD